MRSEKKNRTFHTREFKIEAVKLALQGDRTMQEVADNLGINISNLRRWKKAYLADAEQAFPGQGRLPGDEEAMRTLRREGPDAGGRFSGAWMRAVLSGGRRAVRNPPRRLFR